MMCLAGNCIMRFLYVLIFTPCIQEKLKQQYKPDMQLL